jgi:Spy/CpxP family protein refolding chaperone
MNLKPINLLSIAVAFVTPMAFSLPVQAQEANDKAPAGFNRPMPPSSISIETAGPGERMDISMAIPAGGPPEGAISDIAMIDMGARFLKGDVAVTNEQYEKLHQLKGAFMDKMGSKLVELFSLKRQLKDVLTNADIDSSKANDLKNRIAANVQDMANLKIENEIATMNVYTSEQRRHLREAMLKCPAIGGWGGMGMGMGMGMHKGGPGMGMHRGGMGPGGHMKHRHRGMSGTACPEGFGRGKNGGMECPVEKGAMRHERHERHEQFESSNGEVKHTVTTERKRGGWQPKEAK